MGGVQVIISEDFETDSEKKGEMGMGRGSAGNFVIDSEEEGEEGR